jgi:uncharacterized protein (TIGR03435 family)
MPNVIRKLAACLFLTLAVGCNRSKPAFESATIRAASPLDIAGMEAAIQAGQPPSIGLHIEGRRAEYSYMPLNQLVAVAYKVKAYQIEGPEWLSTARFDISAKLPDGASQDDVPQMLQSLLEQRFGLAVRRRTAGYPVLALVVGEGGPKLTASPEAPEPVGEDATLQPGEITLHEPDGPVRMRVDAATGGGVVDMGTKGKMTYRMDPASQAMHVEFSMVTMSGFADMLTQLFTLMAGDGAGRQVVDMTGIKGNYQAEMDVSLPDLMSMARSAGMALPAATSGGGSAANIPPGPANPAGAAVTEAVHALGLKLESRKAMVERLIILRVSKTPKAT